MFNKKIVIASLFFGLLTSLAIVFRPVPVASVENTLKTIGTVDQVFEAGEQDLIFKLKGDDHLFYVDTESTDGLNLASLKAKLPGKNVEIYYVKYWSPLDSFSKLKHIAKMDLNSTTLYSNLE
ncbi:hypothetical protein WBG78_14865 [Chryseolinea sp. T2]|uniref:hypothetical protein n=1 Tax=Chryseolinea sp. T2 TaxID=3129255 RepID=UPI0030770164